MTGLLSWRNPQGSEENWLLQGGRPEPQHIPNFKKHILKVIVTEIGLACLITTSVIETAAYVGLKILSLPVRLYDDRPYKVFGELLESSSFTILWGVADLLFISPFYTNVMTRESFARRYIPTLVFFRTQDRLYLECLTQNVHDHFDNQ
jgi:hypothetical protein